MGSAIHVQEYVQFLVSETIITQRIPIHTHTHTHTHIYIYLV
jgi:hypothetical protein